MSRHTLENPSDTESTASEITQAAGQLTFASSDRDLKQCFEWAEYFLFMNYITREIYLS